MSMKDILVGRCTTQAGSLAGRFSSPAQLLCSASHFTGCLWGSVSGYVSLMLTTRQNWAGKASSVVSNSRQE